MDGFTWQGVELVGIQDSTQRVAMVRLSRHEQERCRQRRQQWLEKFLPRVHAATRPNSSYLENPEVLELLQHLSDAVNELLMARPLSPLPWLADYLRRAVNVIPCTILHGVSSLTLKLCAHCSANWLMFSSRPCPRP